jgi:hypothetical protein
MASVHPPNRIHVLNALAFYLLIALAAKVLFSILYEYRFYFPVDFGESVFLAERKAIFRGTYRVAFFVHILASPVALVLAFLLMFTGSRKWFGAKHRLVGKIQVLLIVIAVAPSGLVMSTEAFSGPIAGWGFATLSVATAVTAIAAGYFASQRKFAVHQVWATRCFILLCSPLVLRLTAGSAFVMNVESELSYRLSAWLCWLLPLIAYELWRKYSQQFIALVRQPISFSNKGTSE